LKSLIEGKALNTLTEFHNLLEDNGFYIAMTILSPISILGISILLIIQLGWISLVGLVSVVVLEVIGYIYTKYNSKRLKDIAEFKDKRISYTS